MVKRDNSGGLILLVVILAVLLSGCAGSRLTLPPQLTETMAEACTFYNKSKPAILAYRQWAKAHWNDLVVYPNGEEGPLISHEVKDLLLELDSYLPKLDDAGRLVCLVSSGGGLGAGEEKLGGSVDWDRVLATTLRVATLAAELKNQGVF